MERVDREREVKEKLDKLEDLRRSGQISEETYRKMKSELQERLKRIKALKKEEKAKRRLRLPKGEVGREEKIGLKVPKRMPFFGRKGPGLAYLSAGVILGFLTLLLSSYFRPDLMSSLTGLIALPLSAGFIGCLPGRLAGGGIREAGYSAFGLVLLFSLAASASVSLHPTGWVTALSSSLLKSEAVNDPIRLGCSSFLCLLAPSFVGAYLASKLIPRR